MGSGHLFATLRALFRRHDDKATRVPVSAPQMARPDGADDHDAARGTAGPSPMAELRYPREAVRLWRWTDSPLDETIAALTTEFAALSAVDRERMRARLMEGDFGTLMVFAERSALAALRTDDQAVIEPALAALAMITRDRIDYRDLTMTAGLVCSTARMIKAPVARLVGCVAGIAEPGCARILQTCSEAKPDLAKVSGLRKVSTSGGVVLFRTGFHRQSPQSDLAGLAFDCAQALEGVGYDIDSITLDSVLPPVWLGAPAGSPMARLAKSLTSCVSLDGTIRSDPDPLSSGQHLLAFIAEMRSDGYAAAIARAAQERAQPGCNQLGIASGRLCAVIAQRSWLADTPPLEASARLERLRPLFERMMDRGSARGQPGR